jgi:hypothetical protein
MARTIPVSGTHVVTRASAPMYSAFFSNHAAVTFRLHGLGTNAPIQVRYRVRG